MALSKITQTTMVRRILRHYRAASEAQRAIGIGWYPTARRECGVLDIVNPSRAAGVVAALSPRTQWATNLRQAARIIAAADSGMATAPSVSTIPRTTQAWRIANGDDPLDVLGGPKVRSFYRNLTGDDSAVTVDVWATYGATGLLGDDGVRYLARSGNYDALADAYRHSALLVNRTVPELAIAPSALQATIWTVVRGVKPTDRTFHAAAIRHAAF